MRLHILKDTFKVKREDIDILLSQEERGKRDLQLLPQNDKELILGKVQAEYDNSREVVAAVQGLFLS
jgi:hypothetical protein